MLRRVGQIAVPAVVVLLTVAFLVGATDRRPARADVSAALASARFERVAQPPITQRAIPLDTRCRRGKVSITFDDGPQPVYTPRLLKILRREKVRATFFVTGDNARQHPEILRLMHRDGHAVENHSWNHPDLRSLSSHRIRRQLARTSAEIRSVTGRSPGYFRPPYGATSQKIRRIGKKLRMRQELWTIDTRDWTGLQARSIRKQALRSLRPHRSNVILMHDAVTNSPRTLKAVPKIIGKIRAKGYCLVPLEDVTSTDG